MDFFGGGKGSGTFQIYRNFDVFRSSTCFLGIFMNFKSEISRIMLLLTEFLKV